MDTELVCAQCSRPISPGSDYNIVGPDLNITIADGTFEHVSRRCFRTHCQTLQSLYLTESCVIAI